LKQGKRMAERIGGMQDEKVALVFSGGVGLGAYQAGAYAELHEQGGRQPEWLVGSSIGAVNAAIIAGNPPERRVERLRQFWEAAPGELGPLTTVLAIPPAHGPWRQAYSWMSVLQARLFGRPGLFRPHLLLPGVAGEDALGVYDLAPLRARLEELVDFERLNGGEARVTVVTVDVSTGEEVVFDTRHGGGRIEPEHLLASCGFLPDFAPVEIGGRLLGDGGLAANTPLDAVLGERAAEDLLCFVLDLFARDGGRPQSLEAAVARRRDLIFANQSRKSMEAHQREHRLRAMIGRLDGRMPAELRNDPELASVLAEGIARAVTVLHLSYRAPADEVAEKPFDFSPATLAERWDAGALDMAEALRTLARVQKAATRAPGLAIHAIRR
jgi:NTE family protein